MYHLSRVRAVFSQCGPVLGAMRILRRGSRVISERLGMLVWRSTKLTIGSNSMIQSGVQIESPDRLVIGANCFISRDVRIGCEGDGGTLVLHDGVQINTRVFLDHTGNLNLLDGVLISEDVIIYTHSHGQDPRSEPAAIDLTIGRNAWIGARSVVMAGVETIGENAIIAAGSIVMTKVPPNAVVGGNPARIIMMRGGTLAPSSN